MNGRWILLILSLLLAQVASGKSATDPMDLEHIGDTLKLSPARVFGTVSVEEALSQRRSTRDFTEKDLSTEEVSQLLWAAQGITMETPWMGRTAPSAGALYPLHVYLIWRNRLWRYEPQSQVLRLRAEGITQEELANASLGQRAIKEAPACFVITGNYDVTRAKYGDRAERYVHIEVGHAGQSLLLEAVSLGLGAVPMGAFHDAEVKRLLGLPEPEHPLYIIPVGHKSS